MDEIIQDGSNAVRLLTEKKLPPVSSRTALVLREIVQKNGPEIYEKPEALAAQLAAAKIPGAAIAQVSLVLCGTTLPRYLSQTGSGISAIDINNILISAEQAGLSSTAARQVVSDLLYGLSVPQSAQEAPWTAETAPKDLQGIYIPPQAYQPQLAEIKSLAYSGEDLSSNQYSLLMSFVDAGIPKAHAIVGHMYLNGKGLPQDDQQAVKYLQYAANKGEAEAIGDLADYYYGKDNAAAHRLYSAPGGVALSRARWTKFRNLEQSKVFLKSQCGLLFLLWLVTAVFMLVLQTSPITGSHPIAAVICSVLGLLAPAAAIVLHHKNPYQDLRFLAIPLLLLLFIYVLILI